MIKLLARLWAKQSYVFAAEVEAEKSSINGALAAQNAKTIPDLVAQLNKEADEIEANIKAVEDEEAARHETDEYKALAPKQQYDDSQAAKEEKNQRDRRLGLSRRLSD